MNKSPLKWTYWFDPLTVSLINLTTFTMDKGVWIEHQSKPIVVNKQPGISQLKNCAAAITQLGLHVYPWMAVNCDTKYEAAFVCQSIAKSHKPPSRVSVNRTCDSNWLMVDGSTKCFSVLWPDVALSFIEAQDICSAQNASVFVVDVMSRNPFQWVIGNSLKRRILQRFDIHNQYFLQSISDTNIYKAVFGKILASNSGKSNLPYMITEMVQTPGEYMNSVYFANLNNTCSVIEKSYTSAIGDLETFESEERKGWGVKCRSCAEPLNVTGIICEKDSKPHTFCLSQHFKCSDGTCIVYIYKCDSVTDCFDGSDEAHCHMHINNITNQFVSVPFLLSGIPKTTETNKIPIHSICDGIYSQTLRYEKDVCFKYKIKQSDILSTRNIDLFDNQEELFEIGNADYFGLYTREEQMCLKLPEYAITYLNHTHHLRRDIPPNAIRRSRKCSDLKTFCTVQVNKSRCHTQSFVSACVHLSCPGLFKCHRSYCIYMSSVCDGQYDCEENDDEIFCPLASCPGLLKCRGENRCVSKEEICDDTVNCLHSMDDEISCASCPMNCECSGYTMICLLDNSLEQALHSGTYNIKGLILTGVQQQLFLHDILIPRLVYLNASYCGIEKVLISNKKYKILSFIIIASFPNNKLTDILFLSESIFKNIIFLDLSFNLLSFFQYEASSPLKELFVLILRGNPLTRINLNQAPRGSMLSLLDLQHIYDYSSIYIVFTKDLNNQIEVKVSELLMCCILDKHITCTSNDENSNNCIGLFGSVRSKVTFYSLSVMPLIISLIINMKNIIRIMPLMVVYSNKKYYWIASFNNSISEMLASLYLFSLLIADSAKANVLFWTLSPICLILKLIVYISIQTMVIFNTHSIFCVSVKILYPFKHQDKYIKWTMQLSLVVWIIVSGSSLSTFIGELKQDEICSMSNCSTDNRLNLLLLMVCVTAILTKLSCMIVARKVYIALEKNNATWSDKRKQINSYRVTLKLIYPMLLQLPLHICLFNLLAFQLANLTFVTHFCRAVFLFVFPLNVVCCAAVSMCLN